MAKNNEEKNKPKRLTINTKVELEPIVVEFDGKDYQVKSITGCIYEKHFAKIDEELISGMMPVDKMILAVNAVTEIPIDELKNATIADIRTIYNYIIQMTVVEERKKKE